MPCASPAIAARSVHGHRFARLPRPLPAGRLRVSVRYCIAVPSAFRRVALFDELRFWKTCVFPRYRTSGESTFTRGHSFLPDPHTTSSARTLSHPPADRVRRPCLGLACLGPPWPALACLGLAYLALTSQARVRADAPIRQNSRTPPDQIPERHKPQTFGPAPPFAAQAVPTHALTHPHAPHGRLCPPGAASCRVEGEVAKCCACSPSSQYRSYCPCCIGSWSVLIPA